MVGKTDIPGRHMAPLRMLGKPLLGIGAGEDHLPALGFQLGEGKLHQLGSDPFPPVGRLHKYMVDVRDLAVDRREGDKTRPGPVFTEEKDPLFFLIHCLKN